MGFEEIDILTEQERRLYNCIPFKDPYSLVWCFNVDEVKRLYFTYIEIFEHDLINRTVLGEIRYINVRVE